MKTLKIKSTLCAIVPQSWNGKSMRKLNEQFTSLFPSYWVMLIERLLILAHFLKSSITVGNAAQMKSIVCLTKVGSTMDQLIPVVTRQYHKWHFHNFLVYLMGTCHWYDSICAIIYITFCSWFPTFDGVNVVGGLLLVYL